MYQTEDGYTKIEVTMGEDTVWLTQGQMCELFQRDKSVISRHIKNIFDEGELDEESVVANYATTATDGKEYNVKYFNLDVIISVGYRVKSHRGTQFRIWATQRLREFLIKGFTLNDELLKNSGGGNYFDELLQRIRDIRSSEKVFWRKVLDIYSTSIDYDPRTEESIAFFKMVQNKMHWAAHGQTAAEVIFNRVSSEKPFLGLTNFKGKKPTRSEVMVAKNYLNEEEISILNRIVTAYLEFAELQAIRKKPMYMKDWASRLDEFLKMSDNDVLKNAGKVTHEEALNKASFEYEKYQEKIKDEISEVEKHFIASIEGVESKIKNLYKK